MSDDVHKITIELAKPKGSFPGRVEMVITASWTATLCSPMRTASPLAVRKDF